ncbi:MFS transporter [Roseateles sp.]|uniref:MFS transporter n=1 Tax=Roseateles sp. TaxID=1971397 RepID=UPI00326739B7
MNSPSAKPQVADDLRPLQLFFLAAAVFVVSAGYGALLPLLPAWLSQKMPGSTPTEVARHVGFLSGAYTAGVLVGAPIWGWISDRGGRPRILILGLVGYVASLLLLLPAMGGLWTIYVLRAAAGLFVAAVVPLVPALVAAHTPKAIRARRFAWLGASSLLGFLFGPGLNAVADALAAVFSNGAALAALSTRIVIILSALLGALMMLGLALTLPKHEGTAESDADPAASAPAGFAALWWLAVAVNLVLSGFELGIVLQGRQHAELTTQQVAMMFAECSLVMLGINALLFFTGLLDKAPPRQFVAAGSVLGMAGLAVLALHQTNTGMYIGVSLTSAGTGLVLPVIAFLAAGALHRSLGVTMGGLAAAGALGQTLGSVASGWLFGAVERLSFGWLAAPLLAILILLFLRPSWWKAPSTTRDAELSPTPN